jgi:hypothetical protein
MSTVVEKINTVIPIGLDNSTRLDGNAFFKFDITCIQKLFEVNEYKKSISIGPFIN